MPENSDRRHCSCQALSLCKKARRKLKCMSLRLAFARTSCTPMTHCVPMGWNSWNFWAFRSGIYLGAAWWWRLADSNRRPLACEASALTSGARRTGRKPCGARLSIAFSTACSLRLSNPERLRPLLLSYRLIMLLSILLDNTEQLQLFSIIFHHPTATWKNTPHLCIILKSSPKKFKHSAVIWESASATIRP